MTRAQVDSDASHSDHTGDMAGWATLYQIDRISIRGGIGVGLLMGLIVAGVLESLPVLRWPVIGATAVGAVLAGSWILARRRRPLDARTPPLSLGLYEGRRRSR
jgi:hypothetical protein